MDLFWTPNWFLDISFFSLDPLPPWNRWGWCCLMGPACHPLRTVNVSFWILFTKWFLAYILFRSPAAFKTLRTLLAHGSHMSASMNNKRWGCCCLMGPACHPLRTINVYFLGFLTNWFLVYFFFPSPAAFKTLTTLLAHGSLMSASPCKKYVIFRLFWRQ